MFSLLLLSLLGVVGWSVAIDAIDDSSDDSDDDTSAETGSGAGAGVAVETLNGTEAADILTSDSGSTFIQGFGGNDNLSTRDADSSVSTPDTIDGGGGDDRLFGDDGDRLIGGEGADTFEVVVGEPGQDPVIIQDLNFSVENLGQEPDTVNFLFPDGQLLAVEDFLDGGATIEDAPDGNAAHVIYNGEIIAVVENYSADDLSANDIWIGNFRPENSSRLDGDDLIEDSPDAEGEAVANNLYGGAGDDTLVASTGADYLAGGDGDDFLDAVDDPGFTSEPDILIGGAGNDILRGDQGDFMTDNEGNTEYQVVVSSDPNAEPTTIYGFEHLPGAGFEDIITLLDDQGEQLSQADVLANLGSHSDETTVTLTYGGQDIIVLERVDYDNSGGAFSWLSNVGDFAGVNAVADLPEVQSRQQVEIAVTSASVTGQVVGQDMFSANMVYVANTTNGVPEPTFAQSLVELGIEHVRYPGGQGDSAREGDVDGVDWLNVVTMQPNDDGEMDLRPELTRMLDWAADPDGDPDTDDSIKVTLVIPVKSISTEDYPEFAEEIEAWTTRLMERYPELIENIELGNEYWEIGETAYATRASMAAEAVARGMETAGIDESDQPDIIVQMATPNSGSEYASDVDDRGYHTRVREANERIIEVLTDEAKDAIDGVVEHSYFNKNVDAFEDSTGEKNYVNIDYDVWEQAFDKDLSFHLTEWNLKTTTIEQNGLKSLGVIQEHFENLVEMGVDEAHVWAVQHNTTTDLAGGQTEAILQDEQGNLVNTVRGALFQNMQQNTQGAELLELEYNNDGPFEINGYQRDNEMTFYISSRTLDDSDLAVDFSDVVGDVASVEGVLISIDPSTSNGVHWDSKAKAYVDTLDTIVDGERWSYNEHDTRATVTDLDLDGTQIDLLLKPFEMVQVTFTLADDLPGETPPPGESPSDGHFIEGTNSDDSLEGGSGNDTIHALDGDDHVIGKTGDDTIDGGPGRDGLYGWGGNDSISGGDGNDSIGGQQGNDTLNGRAGSDQIFGHEGDDQINGGKSNDLINGGSGADSVTGWAGSDIFNFVAGDIAVGDQIDDFEPAHDVIELDFADIRSMDDLIITRDSSRIGINLQVGTHGTIFLVGEYSVSDIQDPRNFSFVQSG